MKTLFLIFALLGLPGGGEWIIIALVILILFGGRKIPELMKGLGSGIKEFKNARKEDTSDSLADKTSHIDDNKS